MERADSYKPGVPQLYIRRREFLASLSRSALVLTLEQVLASAWPTALAFAQNGTGSPTTSAPPATAAAAKAPAPAALHADLGVTFVNVAKEAGLNAKTIFGGEHKNKYLLETTGCGV